VLAAGITAVSVDENGEESKVTTIKLEKMLTTQTHPLLNYIFFDDNSAVLPDRYVKIKKGETDQLNESRFKAHSTIEVYYEVLNIIGKRMLDYTKAVISINGYNCGEGAEKNNIQLSRQRAESVKSYLTHVWNIPESRIKVSASNLPPVPSSSNEAGGVEENRRVEIISNVYEVLDPIVVRDTVKKLYPPKLVFKPEVSTGIGIDNWEITCLQSGKTIKTFSGKGEPPERIVWDLSAEKNSNLDFSNPIDYMLSITDNIHNQISSSQGRLPIIEETYEYEKHKIVADKEIDQFTLTLFDFDKADIDGRNARAIESAKKRIRKSSVVSIKGYTDQIGEEQHNLQLSQRRASVAARALGVSQEYSEGLGETVKLYDNVLPEQRIYSRSVIITIETPVE
jgi:outer membrane protein OmpA-like peptidoglycan-associated protein